MKARKQGMAVIFLETDLENSTPFDENTLSNLQTQVLFKLSEQEQEKIRAGYATRIIDLDSGNCVCEFNTEGYRPPKSAMESFATAITPIIQKFYADPKNREAFEEWKKEQNK